MPTAPHPDVAALRSIALVGQTTSGKTSLAEALLCKAGAIGAAGSLERGTTVSDFDPMERRAQHSLNASVLHLGRGATRIHLIDTPGYADFVGQSMTALEAVETAAVVINATTGIEAMSHRMMAWAQERGLCRMIIVNKIDALGLDLPGLVADIQAAFGKECLPLNLPAAQGTKVVDCFFNPSGVADFSSVEGAHRALVEQVVEVDPDFVERYLNDGDVDPQELHAPLEQALREGHLVPICFVSARNGAGVAELLDVFERLMPNPAEGNPPQFYKGEGAEAVELHAVPDPAQHVIAHVFKITVDPVRRQDGHLPHPPGHGHTRQPALHRRRAQALQGGPSVHAARQGPRGGGAWPAGRHLRGGQGRRNALRRGAARRRRRRPPAPVTAALPGAGARPGDRAEAAWRRAAHVGDLAKARR